MSRAQSLSTLAVLAIVVVGLAILPSRVPADAVMVTEAAIAPTMCEIYIEPEEIRVELEIGRDDLPCFPNLLPDSLYESQGYEPRPLRERVEAFLTNDWRILVDEHPVSGRVKSMTPGPKVLRDVLTGEPLPTSGEQTNLAVTVVITYPLTNRPSLVRLPAPQTADRKGRKPFIGFVTYHRGVAVNDFRYLGRGEVLDLDWDDPWYSKFRSKSLWRAYNSPMNAFLYIEPYEVRVEIIVRPRDLQQWLDLGLDGREAIPPEIQTGLKQRAAAFLGTHVDLTIDGERVQPTLDRVNFLRRTLRTSSVIDPPEELNIYSAILGAIYVAPTTGLPREAELTWDLFSPKLKEVRAAVTDEAGPIPYRLTPYDNVLHWRNFLKKPAVPELVPVSVPPPSWIRFSSWAGWGVSAVLVGGLALMRRRGASKVALGGVVLLGIFTIGATLVLSRSAVVSRSEARTTVAALLHNVYRSFDFRDESTVYDLLGRSVAGDLLTDVYLETRKALALASQGGARVKVKAVDLLEVQPETLRGEPGFQAHCRWNVVGSVGHWGHIHQRTNQYEAELTIQPVDGSWKISAIEARQEERQ